jgi:protein tyrosine phosphatase (PTP) superfamily phosphohydrolase (DUF442 family)
MSENSLPESMSRRHLFLRMLADLPRILVIMVCEVREVGPWRALQYMVDHVIRLATGAPPEHFSRITDHMHVGGQYTAGGYERLKARGVTSVISLRDEFDNAAAGIAPERYLYLPTIDDTPPTVEDLCAGIRMIREEVSHGGQVYVHCMLGVGRSATLAAAYLVGEGMSASEAWRAIRRRRPFIRPTAGQKQLVADFAAHPMPCAEYESER